MFKHEFNFEDLSGNNFAGIKRTVGDRLSEADYRIGTFTKNSDKLIAVKNSRDFDFDVVPNDGLEKGHEGGWKI
jgi:hypothetical protein